MTIYSHEFSKKLEISQNFSKTPSFSSKNVHIGVERKISKSFKGEPMGGKGKEVITTDSLEVGEEKISLKELERVLRSKMEENFSSEIMHQVQHLVRSENDAERAAEYSTQPYVKKHRKIVEEEIYENGHQNNRTSKRITINEFASSYGSNKWAVVTGGLMIFILASISLINLLSASLKMH